MILIRQYINTLFLESLDFEFEFNLNKIDVYIKKSKEPYLYYVSKGTWWMKSKNGNLC